MTPLPRRFIELLTLSATCITGIWLGEGYSSLVDYPCILAVLLFPLGMGLLVPSDDSRNKYILMGVTVVIFVFAWNAGWGSANRAFDRCVELGPQVREALAKYHQDQGVWPERIEDTGMEVPGKRSLRPPLMEYQRDEQGYRLSYYNWQLTHLATQDQPFMSYQ